MQSFKVYAPAGMIKDLGMKEIHERIRLKAEHMINHELPIHCSITPAQAWNMANEIVVGDWERSKRK